MAMGVPVVTTGVSAIPELVESGRTGLLVPPGRPEAMADAMLTLLTDENLRRRVIPAARERVVRDFDNRALVGRLAGIYRQALNFAQSDGI
jgi:glycosyltransferase involved in cell wall biosynthesis